jgi:3-mercaptopropionate dioxygenase
MACMCDFGRHDHDHHHDHDTSESPHFGFLVDVPEIRALIEETRLLTDEITDTPARVEALKPAFSKLLAADGWLPEEYASPDLKSGMGGGIGQYALYRAEDLCLFSLVIPAGAETPVHDHLAWGLIGVYRGRQDETVYRRLDDGRDEARADLEVSKRQTMDTGEFYALLPPRDDIHFVKTVSEVPSISIHLLANDTACVWRHRFNPAAGTVNAFRSGYSNAPCPEEARS